MTTVLDEELRNLFRAESDEHLQHLEAGLLQLARTPKDQGLLEEVFREAHSLKGSSRMLGLNDIQQLAHEIENMLSDVRQGTVMLSEESITPQLAKLDKIRELVTLAIGDQASETQSGKMEKSPPPAQQTPAATAETKKESQSAMPPSPAQAEFRIDTLRVDSSRLDFLLSQAGELVVSRSRIQRWQSEFDHLINYLQAGAIDNETLLSQMELLRNRLSEDGARLNTVTEAIENGIRNLRLLPLSTLLDQFPRMMHDLAAEQKKLISLEMAGGTYVADKRIIEELKAPLMHLLRNAIDHGIETPEQRRKVGKPEAGSIRVNISQEADLVCLQVADDGRGLNAEAIRQQAVKRGLYSEAQAATLDDEHLHALILQSGFSTQSMITDISGRGIGLDVVRTSMERMRGLLQVSSQPGQGSQITLQVPVSLTSTRVMLIKEQDECYALPFEHIHFARSLEAGELLTLENHQFFYQNRDVIGTARLSTLLEREAAGPQNDDDKLHCVVLQVGDSSFGVLVDELLDEQEIVLKPLAPPLKRVRNVAGITILDSGQVCAVLSVHDLLRSLHKQHIPAHAQTRATATKSKRKTVLLAEDSITTRIQEKRILEAAGYEVITAVDGLDAWNKLASQRFDAVMSDITMPNLTGLELTARIRENRKLAELPVILVTSLASEEDRLRGLEAGADAYLTKPEFDQSLLLDTLARLI